MTDLRQQLIEAIRPHEGDTTQHGSNAHEIADEALAIFAAWLRKRGGQLEPVLHSPRILLRALADEITPTACEHTTVIDLSVPGQHSKAGQCATCGAWIRTPWTDAPS